MSETHFGFRSVDEQSKAERVRGVFDSVAPKYDVMNDLMSLGLHRLWKAYAVAVARVRPGDVVLDIAGGTGDLARAFAGPAGARGMVVHTDINEAMLRQGRDRLLDEGIVLPTLLCDAEALPFASAIVRPRQRRLRPAQHDAQGAGAGRDGARAEGRRPAARARVLEGRGTAGQGLRLVLVQRPAAHRRLGRRRRATSYRYLAESIRVHPDQATLKAMMKTAGFGHVDVHNLSAGVVALHVGIKC